MRSYPTRPRDDVGGLYTPLGKLISNASGPLDGTADQILMDGILGLFWGAALLARYRITAIIAEVRFGGAGNPTIGVER